MCCEKMRVFGFFGYGFDFNRRFLSIIFSINSSVGLLFVYCCLGMLPSIFELNGCRISPLLEWPCCELGLVCRDCKKKKCHSCDSPWVLGPVYMCL